MTAKRRPESGFGGFRLGVRRLPAASFSKECNRRRFSPAGLRSSLRPVSGPGLRSSPVLRPGCRRISPVGLRSSLRPVSGPPVPGAGRTGDPFSPVPGAGRVGPETRFLRHRARAGPETRFLRHRARAGPETRFLRSRARVGPETRFLCYEGAFKRNPVLREGF